MIHQHRAIGCCIKASRIPGRSHNRLKSKLNHENDEQCLFGAFVLSLFTALAAAGCLLPSDIIGSVTPISQETRVYCFQFYVSVLCHSCR
jgi:hypothetical protein